MNRHDAPGHRAGGRRWDDLVADLDGQAAAYDTADRDAAATELARATLAEVPLVDRLRAAIGTEVLARVRGAGQVGGTVREVGADWVLLAEPAREHLVLLVALLSIGTRGSARRSDGLGRTAAGSVVDQRAGVAQVLRRFARDRRGVRVVLDTGDTVTGTIDVVGADHIELAEHLPGEQRRPGAVRGRRWVPFAAIALVRTLDATD
jgi:hypothetical protein